MGISILLADDHPVVRHGLRAILESHPEFIVIGEAEDGRAAVELAERIRPDVMVLDLTPPGLAGLDVLPIVRQRSPHTRIVVFTMYTSEDFVLQALRGGALGYVFK